MIGVTDYKFSPLNYKPILPLVYDDALSYLETIGQLVQKVNEVIDEVNKITTDAVEQAKEYTDEKFAGFQSQLDEMLRELNNYKLLINNEMQQFEQLINGQINIIRGEISDFEETTQEEIIGVNARTDFAIAQNNVYLLTELSKSLAQIKVLNYFTGEYVGVQDMFDYLAMLHAENGILVSVLVNKEKTVNELIALNLTYTDIARNGNVLIV